MSSITDVGYGDYMVWLAGEYYYNPEEPLSAAEILEEDYQREKEWSQKYGN